MDSLAGSLATRRAVRVALVVAAFLGIAAACVAPFATVRPGDSVAFLTIFLTMAAAADGLTAFLLFGQARVGRSLSLMLLSGGYAFSALAICVHAAVFPGLFSTTGLLGAGTQSAVWFWVWWHGGFPLFVIAYAVVQSRRDDSNVSRPIASRLPIAFGAGIVAVVIALAYVTLERERALPTLIAKGHYGLLISTGVGPLVMLSIVGAIASLLRLTRLRTVTDLWLAVALFSSLLDCALTLFAGGRYTAGWYVARVESLFASTLVLLAFLGAVDRILARLARLSRVDGLTGLANRRTFDEDLENAIASGARANRPVSLLMLDVDDFKSFNDTYGHQRGDDALRAIAAGIATALVRRTDLGARYGGEEFAVILAATDELGAAAVAERLRSIVARSAVDHIGSSHGIVTVSIGTSTAAGLHLRDPDCASALIARADAALYRAKAGGRNRVASDVRLALVPPGETRVAS